MAPAYQPFRGQGRQQRNLTVTVRFLAQLVLAHLPPCQPWRSTLAAPTRSSTQLNALHGAQALTYQRLNTPRSTQHYAPT
jgi:hypothetical protein